MLAGSEGVNGDLRNIGSDRRRPRFDHVVGILHSLQVTKLIRQ
jgi:hypothetical protein